MALLRVRPSQMGHVHGRAQVSPGDVVVTEKIRGVDVNDKVKLDRVLMLGSRDETIIGRPLVLQATVSAVVEVCCIPILPNF